MDRQSRASHCLKFKIMHPTNSEPKPEAEFPSFSPRWADKFGEGETEGIFACAEIKKVEYEFHFIGRWENKDPLVAPHWFAASNFASLFVDRAYFDVMAELQKVFPDAGLRLPTVSEVENISTRIFSFRQTEDSVSILAQGDQELFIVTVESPEKITQTPVKYSEVDFSKTEIRLCMPLQS